MYIILNVGTCIICIALVNGIYNKKMLKAWICSHQVSLSLWVKPIFCGAPCLNWSLWHSQCVKECLSASKRAVFTQIWRKSRVQNSAMWHEMFEPWLKATNWCKHVFSWFWHLWGIGNFLVHLGCLLIYTNKCISKASCQNKEIKIYFDIPQFLWSYIFH